MENRMAKNNPNKRALNSLMHEVTKTITKVNAELRSSEVKADGPIYPKLSTLLPEAGIEQAITMALLCGKYFTVAEICAKLNGSEFDLGMVTIHVMRMMNEGKLLKHDTGTSKYAYALKPNFVTGVSSSTTKITTNKGNKVVTQEEAAISEQISLSDGMDRAIWKVMQDRKPRSCIDISKVLEVFGFDVPMVRSRVVTLMMRKWFDRNDAFKPTMYRMRKDVKVPAKEVLTAETITIDRPTTVTAKPPHSIAKMVKDQLALNKAHVAKPVPSPMVAEMLRHTPALNNAPTTAVTVPVVKHYPILPEDSLKVRIWKIMQDGSEFTGGEIALLVCENEYTKESVYALLNAMHTESPPVTLKNYGGVVWFSRRVTTVVGNRRDKYVYKLLPSIPMPVNNVCRPARVKEEKVVLPVSSLPVSVKAASTTLIAELKDKPVGSTASTTMQTNGGTLDVTVVKESVENAEIIASVDRLMGNNNFSRAFGNQQSVGNVPISGNSTFSENYDTRMQEEKEIHEVFSKRAVVEKKHPVPVNVKEEKVVLPPKLVEMGVKIKDSSFTFEEAETLLGVGNVIKTAQTSPMVKLDCLIKGNQFTVEELEDLTMFLISKGFGFNKQK